MRFVLVPSIYTILSNYDFLVVVIQTAFSAPEPVGSRLTSLICVVQKRCLETICAWRYFFAGLNFKYLLQLQHD